MFALAQHHIPPINTIPDVIPCSIESKRDLIVGIPVDPRGTVDIYIDDFIGLTVVIAGLDNAIRLERAPLLGLSTVS